MNNTVKRGIGVIFTVLAVTVAIVILSSIHIVKQYEAVVKMRFGKIQEEMGAGIHFVPPILFKTHTFDMRTRVVDIDKQDVVTADNVSVNVDAVLYFKITDATKAFIKLDNYEYAIEELSQSTLRSVCGKSDFDVLNGERQRLNEEMRLMLEEKTADWGLEVENIEIKHIILHEDMQQIMAKKAIAYREAEALKIVAMAEFDAAMKFNEAAGQFSGNQNALLLRKLATLKEISSNESTVIIPLPDVLLKSIK